MIEDEQRLARFQKEIPSSRSVSSGPTNTAAVMEADKRTARISPLALSSTLVDLVCQHVLVSSRSTLAEPGVPNVC